MSSRVLVVCAHPDDEAMGLAGTLCAHAKAGDRIEMLFLSDGVTARDPSFDPALRRVEIDRRKEMARAAASIVGAGDVHFLDLKNNRLDGIELIDIVKPVENLIRDFGAQIVYTNHGNDLNVDHRTAHQAVLTACRPLPGSQVRAIYAFETPSSTEWESVVSGQVFAPNRFVDISPHLDAKVAAIKAYGEEMRAYPHPRSFGALEALWRWRGAQSGFAAAEAFMVVRERVASA
jgi:LmbE family N-acetylglucosaminyl deacetylase